jgi:signal transduction histidine kinase
MSLPALIAVTGPFLKFVGEVLVDVKRQRLADIDLEQLRLRRTILSERFEECRNRLHREMERAKGHTHQDLISRGLANSTVLDSNLRSIERRPTN